MSQPPNISIQIVGRAADTAAGRLRAGSTVLIQGRVERSEPDEPILVLADRVDSADLFTAEAERTEFKPAA